VPGFKRVNFKVKVGLNGKTEPKTIYNNERVERYASVLKICLVKANIDIKLTLGLRISGNKHLFGRQI